MGTVCALECGSFVGFRIGRKYFYLHMKLNNFVLSFVIQLGGILCCVVQLVQY